MSQKKATLVTMVTKCNWHQQ